VLPGKVKNIKKDMKVYNQKEKRRGEQILGALRELNHRGGGESSLSKPHPSQYH